MTTIILCSLSACVGFFVSVVIIKRDTIWMQERINKLEADND